MKLCIGDVVRLISGAVGIIDSMSFCDVDGRYKDVEPVLRCGVDTKDFSEISFSIIPNTDEVKYAWYEPEDVEEIIMSAESFIEESNIENDEDNYGIYDEDDVEEHELKGE